MLSKNQEKLIRSLQTKKGREKSGLCLVEGQKVIETAENAIEFQFSPKMTKQFEKLVTTQAPQDKAAVAKIPDWTLEDVSSKSTIIVLDSVQDPGNVGMILRLCLGFSASLILIESADVTNPKVVRSSVGALFQVPWIKLERKEAQNLPSLFSEKEQERKIYRLEKTDEAEPIEALKTKKPIILIAGSEGSGIQLNVNGESVAIHHNNALESLNVGNALGIALYVRSS